MPAARAHQQRRNLVVELVPLAFRTGEFDGAADGVAQIDLPVEIVRPCWRIGVFEIRHEDVRAAVKRVDDHLAVHWSGDLHAAIHEIGRNGSNRPFARPDFGSLRKEIRVMAGVEFALADLSAGQQILSPRVKLSRQAGDKALRFRGQYLGIRRTDGSIDLEF